MYRIGFVIISYLLLACNNEKKNNDDKNEDKTGFQYKSFAALFAEVAPPYTISDTGLQKISSPAIIPFAMIGFFIPDSIKKAFSTKKDSVKYLPLAKLQQKGKETYFVVKVAGADKSAALLLVFDKDNAFGATLPFLLPDKDPATSQTTVIDKSYTVSKNITQRSGGDVTGEGKEVLAYDAAEQKFSLIMTDILNDNPAVLINPIDTFKTTNKLAGDYYLNKKNLVSIRDGRRANTLLIYVHTENTEGDCKGELKGEALITSANTAAYRLGGDPCALGLSFTGNTVTIKEESGCGNHRDLDCPLAGSFTRKKKSKG